MDGEQRVGRLGLPVSGPLVVAVLELHVVPAHPRAAMTERRHRHHPGADTGDRRPQPVDEGEVAEMIGRELRLPPRPNTGLGARHDPGVSDQQINVPIRCQEPIGERGDTVEIAQIELVDLHTLHTRQRLGSRGGAASRHHHTGACADQGARRLQPNARVAASHHRQPASQIDALEHLDGSRRGIEPGTDGALRGRHAATVRERERHDEHDRQRHDTPMARSDHRLRGTGYTSQPSDNTHPTWRLDPGAAEPPRTTPPNARPSRPASAPDRRVLAAATIG